jgi:hypothetical protein
MISVAALRHRSLSYFGDVHIYIADNSVQLSIATTMDVRAVHLDTTAGFHAGLLAVIYGMYNT